MRHLLKSAASSHDDSEALNLAIEVVGASGQAHLSRQVSIEKGTENQVIC